MLTAAALPHLLDIYALETPAARALSDKTNVFDIDSTNFPLYAACLETTFETDGLNSFIEERIADSTTRNAILQTIAMALGEQDPRTQTYRQLALSYRD